MSKELLITAHGGHGGHDHHHGGKVEIPWLGLTILGISVITLLSTFIEGGEDALDRISIESLTDRTIEASDALVYSLIAGLVWAGVSLASFGFPKKKK